MDILLEWFSYFARWGHVIAAITWIGTSFYFNWLDLSERPATHKTLKSNVVGIVHEIHGGSFYYHERHWPIKDIPRTLSHSGPAQLTFLTGFILVVYYYWFGAETYLLKPSGGYSTLSAVMASAFILFVPYFIYDVVCKFTLDDKIVFIIVSLMTVGLSFYASTIFNAKAAYVHIGAMLGTIMVANVKFVIIPNHIRMRSQVQKGKPVNQDYHKLAKRRSQHNNYMTLPVVFSMVSIHFPIAFSGQYAWLILVLIMGGAFFIRYYRNIVLREDRNSPLIIFVSLLLLSIGIGLSYIPSVVQTQENIVFENEMEQSAFKIIQQRCTSCHSAAPTFEGIVSPPGGIKFDTIAEIKAQKDRIYKSVITTNFMPPGNVTQMTESERTNLDSWLSEIGVPKQTETK